MTAKKLTEELLNELLDAPSIDGYIRGHDFAAPSLSDYLKQLLQENEAKLQGTIEAIPDLLFEMDLDGRYHASHSPRTELLAARPRYWWAAMFQKCCRPRPRKR